MNRHAVVALLAVVVLQVIDVVLHAAIDQLEAVRVASNVLAVAGAALAVGRPDQAKVIVVATSAAYLGLNGLFVYQEGLVNPNNGNLRVPLFGFVVSSLGLLAWLGAGSMTRSSAPGG